MKSKITEGATISFEITTLAVLDEYCIKHRLQRSQVVEKSVRRFLASEESEDPIILRQDTTN
jgi:hypothetical protein